MVLTPIFWKRNIIELVDCYSYDDIANQVRDYFKHNDLLIYTYRQEFTL